MDNTAEQPTWWTAFRGVLSSGPTPSDKLLSKAQRRLDKLEAQLEEERRQWTPQRED